MTDLAVGRNSLPLGENARANDRAVFIRMYEAEFPYVWKSLKRLGAQQTEVEDLTQEVFAVSLKQWATYDRTRAVRPWLFGICHRVFVGARRKLSHRQEVSETENEVVDEGIDLEKSYQRSQERKLAQKAMAELEPERKAVFILHDVEQIPMPQVAEALQIPLNTAYSRLRLARADFTQAAQTLLADKGAPL